MCSLLQLEAALGWDSDTDRVVNVSAVGEETCRLGGGAASLTPNAKPRTNSHVPRPRSDPRGKRDRKEERGIPKPWWSLG